MTERSAIAIFVLLALAIPRTAGACSCGTVTPREALLGCDAVFAGRVVAVDPGDVMLDITSSRDVLHVRVEVSATWKGPRSPVLTIRTAGDEAVCGVSFVLGEEYLIYAWEAGETLLATNLCSRTGLLAMATEDLAALGAPSSPHLTEAELGGLLGDLRSASAERRMNAFARLAMHPEAASDSVPLIVLGLGAGRERLERSAAADALGRLGPAAVRALPALQALLSDPDPAIGTIAADALARMGDVASPAVAALVGCLHDQPAIDALETLLERLPPSRVAELPELERRLGAFAERRAAVVHALGKIGPAAKDQASEIVLRAMLDGRVQPRQAWTLRAMGVAPEAGAIVTRVLAENPRVGWPAMAILEHLGPDAGAAAVPVLASRLRSERDSERDLAADALGAMGPAASGAVPALLSALDEVEISESSVIQALVAIRDPRSAAVLARAFQASEHEDVREIAARGLLRMGLDPAGITPAPGRPRGQSFGQGSEPESFVSRAPAALPPNLDGVPRLPFLGGFALEGAGMCDSMAPHPEGLVIALGCREQVARLHDVLTGHVLRSFEETPPSGSGEARRRFGGSVAVVGDTTYVGAPGYSGSVIECGAVFAHRQGASGPARIDSPIPTREGGFGSLLVAGPGRIAARLHPRRDAPAGSIVLLDQAGSLLREILLLEDLRLVAKVAFVGNLLAVGARTVHGDAVAGAVVLFDAGTGERVRVLQAPEPSDADGFGDQIASLGSDALLVSRPDRLHVVDVSTGAILATVGNPEGEGRAPAALAAIDADRFAASSRSLGGSVIVHDRSGRPLGVATSPLQGAFEEIGWFGWDLAIVQGRLVATIRNIDAATFNAWVRGDGKGDSFRLGTDTAFLAFDLGAARPPGPADPPATTVTP